MSKISVSERAGFISSILKYIENQQFDAIYLALMVCAMMHNERKDGDISDEDDMNLEDYIDTLTMGFDPDRKAEYGEDMFYLINYTLPISQQFTEVEMANHLSILLANYETKEEIKAFIENITHAKMVSYIDNENHIENVIKSNIEKLKAPMTRTDARNATNQLIDIVEAHYEEYIKSVKILDYTRDIYEEYYAMEEHRIPDRRS